MSRFDTFASTRRRSRDSVTVRTFRAERNEDYPEVLEVVERAFGQPDEARLAEALRRSPAFVPGLSFVAEEEARRQGHLAVVVVGHPS